MCRQVGSTSRNGPDDEAQQNYVDELFNIFHIYLHIIHKMYENKDIQRSKQKSEISVTLHFRLSHCWDL